MDIERRTEELLEVARALLLLQGAILVATTIESIAWGLILPGAGGPILLSAAAAAAILVARARLRADRRRPRRVIYLVEGLAVAIFAADVALAVAVAHTLPPPVALVTQLALPLAVVTLLRRSARAATGPTGSRHVTALEVAP
ncbi:MAG TPA: hypothetical protein VGT60_07220 [Candidatus Limnocylindria bacterium]|nr:hypothetical protein [Candidatus Limnocylindria bacterium]